MPGMAIQSTEDGKRRTVDAGAARVLLFCDLSSDLCPLNGLIGRKTILPTFAVLKAGPPEGHTKQKKGRSKSGLSN